MPSFHQMSFPKKNNKIMALCLTLKKTLDICCFFALFVKYNTSCVHVLISPLPSRRKGGMGEKEEAINQSGGNSNQKNSKTTGGNFLLFKTFCAKL